MLDQFVSIFPVEFLAIKLISLLELFQQRLFLLRAFFDSKVLKIFFEMPVLVSIGILAVANIVNLRSR
jgi:hypothetical protein